MGNCYSSTAIEEHILKRNRKILPFGQNKVLQISKFVVFGQEKTGKSFFTYFDYSSKMLKNCDLPLNSNFFNYSGVTMKDENTMVVCGGIKHDLRGITNTCFEYNFTHHICRKLPNMNNIRYTFPIIYKDNYIYAIGGRTYGDDFNSLMNKCERYNYKTKKWQEIAPMAVKRCTASLMIYKGNIWVMGGYTGRFQRSKKIERYVENLDIWEILDFKLYYGFENGNIIPGNKPDEIIILGGKLNFGFSKNVWEYNLSSKTVMNRRMLKKKSILSKYNIYGDETVILSEDDENNKNFLYMEKYNKKSFKNEFFPLVVNNKNLEKFKQYNFSSPNLEIEHDENNIHELDDINYKNQNVIFGTDDEPFQLNVDSVSGEVRLLAIPTDTKLHNLQGCTRLNENEVFFCGGIKVNLRKIESLAFIFNLKTRKNTKIPKMYKIRYQFPCQKMGNYIYAVGGRLYGTDLTAVIGECERYNLIEKKWEYINSLNISRSASNLIVYNKQLFVFGGNCTTGHKTDVIEMFNEESISWDVLGVKMPKPLSWIYLLENDSQIFFFGGRDSKEYCEKYSIDLEKGDLSQFSTLENLPFKTFLHFFVKVKEDFVVFGGASFKAKEFCLLNGRDLSNIKNFRTLNKILNDTELVSSCNHNPELNYNDFVKELSRNIDNASFNLNLMERNSFVLNFEKDY